LLTVFFVKLAIPSQSPSIIPLTFTKILRIFRILLPSSGKKRRKIQMCSFWIVAIG
jgi:hypothetical protein